MPKKRKPLASASVPLMPAGTCGPESADDQPGPLDDLMPNDFLMFIAWRDCLLWAITRGDLMDAFRRETGHSWRPPANGLERLIDEACGVPGPDLEYVRAFVTWFNENVWGDLDLVAGEASDEQ